MQNSCEGACVVDSIASTASSVEPISQRRPRREKKREDDGQCKCWDPVASEVPATFLGGFKFRFKLIHWPSLGRCYVCVRVFCSTLSWRQFSQEFYSIAPPLRLFSFDFRRDGGLVRYVFSCTHALLFSARHVRFFNLHRELHPAALAVRKVHTMLPTRRFVCRSGARACLCLL